MTAAATFNNSIRIITYSLKDCGKLEDYDVPTPDQLAEGTNRLNDLINTWQTQGLKLWLNFDQSVTLVAGTAAYTLGPGGSVISTKPPRVISGYYLDSSNVHRPIFPLSWDEWTRLSTTTTQGAISQYFVDKQRDNLVVNFWLVPDSTAATGTAHLVIQKNVANFTGLTDQMDFPQEWFMALRWGLADDWSTGQPQIIMERCQTKAIMYRTMLEDWDVEDAATSFQPDTTRGAGGNTRSFI